MMQSLADLGGRDIANWKIFNAISDRLRKVECMGRAVEALFTENRLNNVLDLLVHECRNLILCDRITIYVYDSKHKMLMAEVATDGIKMGYNRNNLLK